MSSFGFIAAVAAPFVMTVGFIFWDNHWRGGSTFALNLFKCNVAAVGFLIASVATRGGSFPSNIFTFENVGFLLLSSAIGIIIGDLLWLEGLRLLGARRVIVVDAVKPFLSALMGWAILGETLRYPAFLGMALTVAGVLVVSLEQTAVATAKDGDMPSITTVTATTASQHGISDEQAQHEPVDDGADETKQCELSATEDVETTSTKNGRPSMDGDNSDKSNQQSPPPREGLVVATPQDTTPTNNEQQPKCQQGSMRENRTNNNTSLQRRGYAMAVLNVVLDTYGSVLTKQYGAGMTTWEISLIRFGFAGIVMLVISVAVAPLVDSVVRRRRKRRQSNEANEASTNIMSPPPPVVVDQQDSTDTTDSIQSTPPWYALPAARDMSRRSWAHVMAGVALVTFLTPALSNYALFQVALALALTLGSVGPLYALPLSWWLQGDRPTVRACWGAAMAVAGVAVLSLFGNSSTV